MDIEIFVQNLKSRLDAMGISYTRAGRESGAGEEFIRNMERKKSMPSVDKVQMMADYLGVTTSELLGENTKPATVSGDGPDPELWELLKRIPDEQMPEVERYLRFQAEQKEKP